MKIKENISRTLRNGQIFERYTMKEMKSNIIKEYNNGYWSEDDMLHVLYNDGTIKTTGFDDILPLTGIVAVIYLNSCTQAIAGNIKHFKLYEYGGYNCKGERCYFGINRLYGFDFV